MHRKDRDKCPRLRLYVLLLPIAFLVTHEYLTRLCSVIGEKGQMAYLGRSPKFPFPVYDATINMYLGGCKVYVDMCYLCTVSGFDDKHYSYYSYTSDNRPHESVTVHHDCFTVFIQSCPIAPRLACERLWEVAIARRPWPSLVDAAPISPPGAYIMCTEAVERVASAYNLAQLATLPVELVEQIQSHSPGYTTFWGTVAALTMAEYVITNVTVLKEQHVALHKILSWQRGGEIDVLEDDGLEALESHTDFLRITYDADGVRQIERLPQWPTRGKERPVHTNNKKLAWAIVDIHHQESRHKEVTAICKNGFLRFDPGYISKWQPGQHLHHQVWNTPTPPEWVSTFPYQLKTWMDRDLSAFQTGHLVNLDSVSGLTFAYDSGKLAAIYQHPKSESDREIKKRRKIFQETHAIPLLRPWSEREDKSDSCFFLPVSEEDKIMAFGVGEYRNADVIVVSMPSPRFHCFPSTPYTRLK